MLMGVDITARQETACQDLLKSRDLVNGWLRQKTRLHKLSDAIDRKLSGKTFESLATIFSWEKRFVILKEGFAYFYSSETAKKANKVLDLGAFKSVQKLEHVKAKDVAWPFKLDSILLNKDLFLSASSHDDQQHWMNSFQKGINEAEAAGRQMKPPASPSDGQSNISSSSSDAEYCGDYDEIPDHLTTKDDSESKVKGGGGGGGGGCAEYECHSEFMPPKAQTKNNRPVPPVPTPSSHAPGETSSDDGNLKTKPKPAPATKPKPAVEPKTSRALPPTDAPRPPKKDPISSVKNAVEDDVDVEYEVEDNIFAQALWTGNTDEGIHLMRSIGEDGVFMIRQSTTGNGDQTLQVIAKGELKKYKLIKEGGQYRMAGGKSFNNVLELLKYYQSNNIPNYDTKLKTPYKQSAKH